ncbi:MAG: type II toxin-antitoxin system death-on-curing family toxin [Clostridia bacterium]|nr:type II toxin-antitoxin system death-on-curing family toxin [Clostridia bacterium]
MILLTTDEIIELHSKIINRTGGSDGLRDINLLESAVYSAMASFADTESYPTTQEKAARLMFSLVTNHAFVDGNKRIGVFVMLMTLKLNNIEIKYTQAELISLGLSTAAGQTDYDGILNWIKTHKA